MRNKFHQLSMRLYAGAYGAVQQVKHLKDDERGLSGVVVAVLLILVAVLAVALLWGGLKDWITKMWDIIIGKSDTFQ